MKSQQCWNILVIPFVWLGLCLISSSAFNLEPLSPVILTVDNVSPRPSRDKSPHFGYSHAFFRENDQSWLLIGAPRTNVSKSRPYVSDYNETEEGAVYKCNLTEGVMRNNTCSELIIDDNSSYSEPHLSDQPYNVYRSNQWMGATIDTADSGGRAKIVACGHLRKIVYLNGYCGKQCSLPFGICFARDNLDRNQSEVVSRKATHGETSQSITFAEISGSETATATRAVYRYAYAQWGISVRLSKEGFVIMGAPGTYQWQGAIIVNVRKDKTIAITNVAVPYSYLGYSVTQVRLPSRAQKELIIAGGAPRYNETGRVIVFAVKPDGNEYGDAGRNSILQEISIPNSLYSYFGASLLAEDVNGDGNDELFVGVPMYNRSKGDEGSVYYYVFDITQNAFLETKELSGTNQAGSRFGTAIASIGDMNLDGYKDIVIGSPYENDGTGAIYIYQGSSNGIVTPHRQRISASEFASHLKAFGGSIGTGKDIDGNSYPDLSVGAFMSDSVVIIRTRPVHGVTAKFSFLASVIQWQKLNCSKTNIDQQFKTTLIISFHYHVPHEEFSNSVEIFLLTDQFNRFASANDSTQRVVLESSSSSALQLLLVPCLAISSDDSCVSFRIMDRAGFHLCYSNEAVSVASRSDDNSRTYNQDCSFKIGRNLLNEKRNDRNLSGLSFSIEVFSKPSYFLHATEDRILTAVLSSNASLPAAAIFIYTSRKHLSCMEGVTYQLQVDRRALLQNKESQWSQNVKEEITFTAKHLYEPLNRSWTVMLPKYPKNIDTPLKFELVVTGPVFRGNSSQAASNVRFNRLLPMLDVLSEKKFTGEIGFQKECGDDNVCDAKLSASMMVVSDGGGVIIGGMADLELRFSILNSGESAHSVRLEISHSLLLKYNFLTQEDECNEVAAQQVETGTNNVSIVNCDVENQLHTNESIKFKMNLNSKEIQTEDDFPYDRMNLSVRTGTQGSIRNGTDYSIFSIPVRYHAKLQVQGRSDKTTLEVDSKFPEITYTFKHLFDIRNSGPGLMPSVFIDVLYPVHDVINATNVQVKESPSMEKRRINGTGINVTSFWEDATNGTSGRLSSSTSQEGGGVIQSVLQFIQGSSPETVQSINCHNGPCRVDRYDIGSMYIGDSIDVSIEITILNAEDKYKNPLEIATFVHVRPDIISADVRQWAEKQVNISEQTVKVSTTVKQTVEPPTIPIWIYIVAAVVGLIHLIVIIFVLWKCGFFKRAKYEELKEARHTMYLQAEEADELAKDLEEQGSQYDNDAFVEKQSQKSRSQYSIAGSYNNEAEGELVNTKSPAVDELLAKHPGIDFTAE